MESSPTEEFRDTSARFVVAVDAVGDAEWDRASPVEGWAARDVVGHLVEWFPAFLRAGADIEVQSGPRVEDDPAGAWHALSAAVQALLDDPATPDRVLRNPHIGEVPLADAVSRFFTPDVFMHTWDLARATGQDDSLDPGRCAAYLDAMLPMDEVLRASGQYGPKVEVAPDADPQTRLIAFIGRDPAWRAV